MRMTIERIVSLCLLLGMLLTACSGPTRQAQVPLPTSVSELNSTPAPSATFAPELILPEDTSTSVATPDMTETAIRAYAATANVVSTEVAAQGGSWPEIEGTLDAMGLLQAPTAFATLTPTPPPFPVSTQEVQMSWGTAIQYSFADPNDLLAARQAYEQYFNFVSFRTSPPLENIEEGLAEHMVRDGSGIGPNSCLFADMVSSISGKASNGRYIRLTMASGLTWDDNRVLLDVGPSGINVAVGWSLDDVQVELVEIKTDNIIQQKQMDIAGTAHLVYVSDIGQWRLEDDEGGFYCAWIGFLD